LVGPREPITLGGSLWRVFQEFWSLKKNNRAKPSIDLPKAAFEGSCAKARDGQRPARASGVIHRHAARKASLSGNSHQRARHSAGPLATTDSRQTNACLEVSSPSSVNYVDGAKPPLLGVWPAGHAGLKKSAGSRRDPLTAAKNVSAVQNPRRLHRQSGEEVLGGEWLCHQKVLRQRWRSPQNLVVRTRGGPSTMLTKKNLLDSSL